MLGYRLIFLAYSTVFVLAASVSHAKVWTWQEWSGDSSLIFALLFSIMCPLPFRLSFAPRSAGLKSFRLPLFLSNSVMKLLIRFNRHRQMTVKRRLDFPANSGGKSFVEEHYWPRVILFAKSHAPGHDRSMLFGFSDWDNSRSVAIFNILFPLEEGIFEE